MAGVVPALPVDHVPFDCTGVLATKVFVDVYTRITVPAGPDEVPVMATPAVISLLLSVLIIGGALMQLTA